MQGFGRVLLGLAGLVCAVTTASAQSPWYFEAGAGAIWRADRSFSTKIFNTAGLTGPGVDTDVFNPGPVINFGAGYKLPYGFRAEVEGGYAHYQLASIGPLSTDGTFPVLNGSRLGLVSGGGRDQYSATLNLFYDLPAFGIVVPYIGGGAGAEYLNAQTGIFTGQTNILCAGTGTCPPAIKFTQSGGHQTDPLLLVEAGLEFKVNSIWSVVPSYRYEWAFPTSGSSLNAQIFEIGVRYSR